MHERGHIGTSLLVYTPFVMWWIKPAHGIAMAALGVVFVVTFAMVPDLDMKIPIMKHRGFSHTLWFAMIVGGIGWYIGSEIGLGLLVGVLSFLVIWSHILGDALTPMGIRPFHPVSDMKFTLDLWNADSKIGNTILLLLGVGVLSWGIGTDVFLLTEIQSFILDLLNRWF